MRVVQLFAVPFIILLIPFIALGVAVAALNGMITSLVQRVRWLRGLRRSRRVIAAAELLNVAREGTLIVDRPGFDFRG